MKSLTERRGSPGRIRTADRVVNSHLLYQLSYRGSVNMETVIVYLRDTLVNTYSMASIYNLFDNSKPSFITIPFEGEA